jgi:tellurite resistance protein
VAFHLPAAKLERLRDRLRDRGRAHQSMLIPSAAPNVVEAVEFVEGYADICQVMYLMMVADGRVLNVEREVLRGALDILFGGRVRTAHMDAILDASARHVARRGVESLLGRAVESLRGDELKAETTVVLAAVVAVADEVIKPEEQALLSRLARELGIGESRANQLVEELSATLK